MKKVILLVLDSLGIGGAPDAAAFGDEGSDTLGHIVAALDGLALPNLAMLGLGEVSGLDLGGKVGRHCAYGRLRELSAAKDTVTGHWEMCGIISERSFPTYPQGFPLEMIAAFERAAGTKILGNEPASGTEIIQRLGPEHCRTGYPIVYTSADSVWQIAAHEEVVGLEKLYFYCQTARQLFSAPPHNIGRIIARPFVGKAGNYTRTANRRDYALPPAKENLLNDLQKAGEPVAAIGKIEDIFAGIGISYATHTVSNADGMVKLQAMYRQWERGLIFVNLVDFDAKFGHRRDAAGYGAALSEFDACLGELLTFLDEETLLMITADHGCDPTYSGTDHTREEVPVLCWHKGIQVPVDLGVRDGFGHIGATVADYLGAVYSGSGISFWPQLKGEGKG